MQIKVINKVNGRQYWLTKSHNFTNIHKRAMKFENLIEVVDIINKFKIAYKILLLTNNGEVIEKYE